MAALKPTGSNRIVILGKNSKPALKHFNILLAGTGVEIGCDQDFPMNSNQNNCILVVLDSDSQPEEKLRSLLTGGTNKMVILDLEDLRLAKLSSEITNEICWMSSKDPVSLLGILSDGFQGAYWRGSELVISNSNSFDIFGFAESTVLSPTDKKSILAAVLVSKICGLEEHQIQKKMGSFLAKDISASRKNDTKTAYTEAV